MMAAILRFASLAASPPLFSASCVARSAEIHERPPVPADERLSSALIAHRVDDMPTYLVWASAVLSRSTCDRMDWLARSSLPPPRPDEQHNPRVDVVADRPAQQRRRALALRGAVGEPSGLQVLLDVVPERHRDDRKRPDDGKHKLRPPPGQIGNSLEHVPHSQRYQREFLNRSANG